MKLGILTTNRGLTFYSLAVSHWVSPQFDNFYLVADDADVQGLNEIGGDIGFDLALRKDGVRKELEDLHPLEVEVFLWSHNSGWEENLEFLLLLRQIFANTRIRVSFYSDGFMNNTGYRRVKEFHSSELAELGIQAGR